ncbi:N-formylglutamate amidohydrolase [Christiangramia echinicola]|uniref:Predicted N-formylglutamate amidohydrolase n=1 Tax=Christiangramia echinicola TaxID=279359 RepID=A0A1H1RZG9_9FLAO|nr:N-formylglutamate amidohydrolase [Christiangramia echinicola]SDS41130.1 Predicted N-formylglutamate amidohydrolase [Christiangramia echinicola]
MKLVLTCEHAFPDIPEKYKQLFLKDINVLKTHEAYDPGAFDVFQKLKILGDVSHYQKIGRLLIESNRSEWHRSLFSRFSEILTVEQKKELLDTYYIPYRNEVIRSIKELIDAGDRVVHISIHSFTPVLYGKERNADIGLLYDSQSKDEKQFARKWKVLLLNNFPDLKVRFNYPYLGRSDGFTTSLRKLFPENYVGIELEMNQKWVSGNKLDDSLKHAIFRTIKELKEKP